MSLDPSLFPPPPPAPSHLVAAPSGCQGGRQCARSHAPVFAWPFLPPPSLLIPLLHPQHPLTSWPHHQVARVGVSVHVAMHQRQLCKQLDQLHAHSMWADGLLLQRGDVSQLCALDKECTGCGERGGEVKEGRRCKRSNSPGADGLLLQRGDVSQPGALKSVERVWGGGIKEDNCMHLPDGLSDQGCDVAQRKVWAGVVGWRQVGQGSSR